MIAYLSIIAGVFAADLATKMVVRAQLPLGAEVPVFPFFSITHVLNTGIAFGLFQGRNTLFLILGFAILGLVAWTSWRLRAHDRFSALALAAVVGGAFGNLVDRAAFGQVTDFLSFHLAGWYWPDFNVADSAICIGAALLFLRGFRSPAADRSSHVSR